MLHEYNKQSRFARTSLLGLYFQTHIKSLIRKKPPYKISGALKKWKFISIPVTFIFSKPLNKFGLNQIDTYCQDASLLKSRLHWSLSRVRIKMKAMANTGTAKTKPIKGRKVTPITTSPRESTMNSPAKKYLETFSDVHLLFFIISPFFV